LKASRHFGACFPVYACRADNGGSRRKKSNIELRAVRVGVWLGGFMHGGAYIICNVALNLTAATMVGFLMSLPVVFVPVLCRSGTASALPLGVPARAGGAVAGLYFAVLRRRLLFLRLGEALVCRSCVWRRAGVERKSLQSLSPLSVSFIQLVTTAVLSVWCAYL
jgi:hypothetical protein